MEFFKKIIFRILYPHTVFLLIFSPVAAIMVIYSLACDNVNPVIRYSSYLLSAYALTIICMRMPPVFRKIKKLSENSKYISVYKKNTHLKTKISLYGTFIINAVYAIIQLISGFYFHSIWFWSLAIYYIILAVMRFFLLYDLKQNAFGVNLVSEYRRYRFCGIMLVLMNLTLGTIVFYIVYQNRGFEYHYIHTIALAAYTFTLTAFAIVNVVKYRRYKSPAMSAAKIISLASALVSVLSLETSMLNAFGKENSAFFRRIMTASTGGAICIFILITGIYMIISSSLKLDKLSERKNQNG
ncbi:MAG: hypothetical protein IJA12_07540 [Oscillospiraceae bacterium]|nr:hypothetical protein [Oscillospiraceae bacterium]